MDVLVGGRLNTLASKPFASGGEGALHDMRWANAALAVKRYRPAAPSGDGERRRARAEWLVTHAPPRLRDVREGWEVAWPTDVVTLPSGEFVGVALSRVRGAVRLSELTAHAWTVSRRLGARWEVYQLPSRLALALRLQLAARVARAVAAVHASGAYVLGDLKPDNILLHADGRVTLVDCDSVQVSEDGRLLYAASVHTDDYTPPEGVARGHDGEPVTRRALDPSWDAFSLAVLTYQLLLGVHPHAVRAFDPATGRMVQTVRDAIAAGVYAHAPRRVDGIQVQCAPPHDAIAGLPSMLQAAFARAFVNGHADASQRPVVAEWVSLLPLTCSWRGRLLAWRCRLAMRGAVLRAQGRYTRDFVTAIVGGVRDAWLARREARRRSMADRWEPPRARLRDLVTLRDLFCVQAGAMATLVALVWVFGEQALPVRLGGAASNDGRWEEPDAWAAPNEALQRASSELLTPAGVAFGASEGAPLLASAVSLFPNAGLGSRAGDDTWTESALRPGTVLTYARGGMVAWRDSVIAHGDSAIVMLRRPVADGRIGAVSDTVRLERTAHGVRLTDAREGVLLLPAGARVGDAWRSEEVPTLVVQASAIRQVETLAGRFTVAELVVWQQVEGEWRRRRLWVSSRVGVVRVEGEGGDSASVTELLSITR